MTALWLWLAVSLASLGGGAFLVGCWYGARRQDAAVRAAYQWGDQWKHRAEAAERTLSDHLAREIHSIR